jgi:flagellar basal-body rod protein FlgC
MASLLQISASGMTAERFRLDLISNNIANATTTRAADNRPGPYRRQVAITAPRMEFANYIFNVRPKSLENLERAEGVRVVGIWEDDRTLGKKVYEPGHPDADADGYVEYPNVNIVTEMVDMITASRAYEANITAFNESKQIMSRALDIGRV